MSPSTFIFLLLAVGVVLLTFTMYGRRHGARQGGGHGGSDDDGGHGGHGGRRGGCH